MTPPGALPVTTHPSILAGKFPPRIQHVTFSKAILNPPVTWTYGDLSATYPVQGYSQVKMVYFIGGSGYFFNQMSNVNEHVQGIQSPNLQIVICQSPWWHALPYYSDIVLPVAHNGERDDITNWNNYSVYLHTISAPPGEAMNDLDVFRGLATRLNLLNNLTGGLTDAQMLQQLYSQSNIPMTFSQFQQVGYYKWNIPASDTPYVGMQAFNTNPKANPLPTPSGLIEIYSGRVANVYGTSDPAAPTIPMYVQATESPDPL